MLKSRISNEGKVYLRSDYEGKYTKELPLKPSQRLRILATQIIFFVRMEKLTLSIRDREKIEWAKAFAREHETSLSRLFEDYLKALMAFDQREVVLSETLRSLQQPGQRPGEAQIERHLRRRRNRSTPKKDSH